MKNTSRGLKYLTPDNTVQKDRNRFLSLGFPTIGVFTTTKFRTRTALLLRALAFLAALCSTGIAFAQTFAPTRFPPQGPQYVETDPLKQNWLYSGASTLTGDYTGANVVFFEIPDTTTQTLYFAVRNPGVDAVNGTGTNDPDRTVVNAAQYWVDYT